MSVYFEKARELGELIIQSEESINVVDARTVFSEQPEAVAKMNEYNAYQRDVQTAMESGAMDETAFKAATKRMTEMAAELKSDAVIGALVKAENEFNYFVNQIMNVLKVTITGDTGECGGDCEGGCSGCGH